MSERKTAEDLQSDAVGLVYGILKIAKYITYFILICVLFFFYKIIS